MAASKAAHMQRVSEAAAAQIVPLHLMLKSQAKKGARFTKLTTIARRQDAEARETAYNTSCARGDMYKGEPPNKAAKAARATQEGEAMAMQHKAAAHLQASWEELVTHGRLSMAAVLRGDRKRSG